MQRMRARGQEGERKEIEGEKEREDLRVIWAATTAGTAGPVVAPAMCHISLARSQLRSVRACVARHDTANLAPRFELSGNFGERCRSCRLSI